MTLQLGLLPTSPHFFLSDILTIIAEPQGSDSYALVCNNSGV
jgi:hypothetical protein